MNRPPLFWKTNFSDKCLSHNLTQARRGCGHGQQEKTRFHRRGRDRSRRHVRRRRVLGDRQRGDLRRRRNSRTTTSGASTATRSIPRTSTRPGLAGKLDYLIYDFENIDPTNLTCFEATKASDSTNESDPNAGDGAGDAYADYQKTFDASTSVDGVADTWNQPLVGTFNQLKKLKAKYPNLKIHALAGRLDVLEVLLRRGRDRRQPAEVRLLLHRHVHQGQPAGPGRLRRHRGGGRHLRRLRHRLGVPGRPRPHRQPRATRTTRPTTPRCWPSSARNWTRTARPTAAARCPDRRCSGRAGQDRPRSRRTRSGSTWTSPTS